MAWAFPEPYLTCLTVAFEGRLRVCSTSFARHPRRAYTPSDTLKTLHIALSAALTLSTTAALAGASYDAAYCQKNADGSGYCFGTFRAFRNHWSADTYVDFAYSSDALPAFYASFQQSTTSPVIKVTCFARTDAVKALWPALMGNEQYFGINWDASGTCTQVSMSRGSKFVVP